MAAPLVSQFHLSLEFSLKVRLLQILQMTSVGCCNIFQYLGQQCLWTNLYDFQPGDQNVIHLCCVQFWNKVIFFYINHWTNTIWIKFICHLTKAQTNFNTEYTVWKFKMQLCNSSSLSKGTDSRVQHQGSSRQLSYWVQMFNHLSHLAKPAYKALRCLYVPSCDLQELSKQKNSKEELPINAVPVRQG